MCFFEENPRKSVIIWDDMGRTLSVLEMSVSRAMMQDGDLRKRFQTRRFQDGKILARNDLYREF